MARYWTIRPYIENSLEATWRALWIRMKLSRVCIRMKTMTLSFWTLGWFRKTQNASVEQNQKTKVWQFFNFYILLIIVGTLERKNQLYKKCTIVEWWSCPWQSLMRSVRMKDRRILLNLTLDKTLTRQQTKLLLNLYEVINLRMLWSCVKVLREVKLHYIRMRYQYELHQGIHQSMVSFSTNIRMAILMVLRNKNLRMKP